MSQAKQPPYVIVVAVDYSEIGDLALERALELSQETPGAELHVVNVVPLFEGVIPDLATGGWVYSMPTLDETQSQLQNYVTQKTASFCAQRGVTLPAPIIHQRIQVPASEIAQLAADLEADLVVVGTHGRRGLSRLVLGSVAEATIRLAPCPVLVVRPKAAPVAGPLIAPACPRCLEARRASHGKEVWCEQHRERHGQRHTYHQDDRVGAETNMPLVFQR
jgi:nucleotide-binding universal stress UspA family protein